MTALRDAAFLSEKPTARVLALLNTEGEEARIVGGAVRDALLGMAVGDIDIATTALPEEVMRRAAAAHIKAVPTGLAHGTVTLVADGKPFEVTTLREDVETFGRKARVAFGRDWARDAQRRDFTINGLSLSRDGTVHDAVGGLADIAAKRVRFIGDPDTRIAEDYLRILRFFRIHAAYGEGEPDRDALLACIRGRSGLPQLSTERVRVEMLKLMLARGPSPAIDAMADAGILLALTGGVAYRQAFAAMAKAENDLGIVPDAIRRLAALGLATTEDAERIARRLRLSNAESAALLSMADGWWRLRGIDDGDARRVLYRLGPDRYRDRVLLAWSRDGDAAGRWLELATLPQRWTAPAFPLRAADFIARGIAAGPALGHVLKIAEEDWLARDLPIDRTALDEIAERTVAEFTRVHRL